MQTTATPPAVQQSGEGALGGPCYEYIQILRSYLSDETRAKVKAAVELHCAIHGMPTRLQYADLLQDQLTPWQCSDARERLELVLQERGWLRARASRRV